MNQTTTNPQTGLVLQYQSNVYTVAYDNRQWQAMVKGVLKKEGVDVLVGDRVMLDSFDETNSTARITAIEERSNQLSRPKVANVTQALVVVSATSPELDLTQLDRYLTRVQVAGLSPMICITKVDLLDDAGKAALANAVKLYESLGVPVWQTSIYDRTSVQSLFTALRTGMTVMAGQSGVGKSSLLNVFMPDLNLKVGDVSAKNERGQHTTRSAKLVAVSENAYVVDTPGFSYLKFDDVKPQDIEAVFADFSAHRDQCHFHNCLHRHEEGCYVRDQVDSLNTSRWASYQAFIEEAQAYETMLSTTSQKEQYGKKQLDKGKDQSLGILRLNERQRQASRRTQKQQFVTHGLDDDDADGEEWSDA